MPRASLVLDDVAGANGVALNLHDAASGLLRGDLGGEKARGSYQLGPGGAIARSAVP